MVLFQASFVDKNDPARVMARRSGVEPLKELLFFSQVKNLFLLLWLYIPKLSEN